MKTILSLIITLLGTSSAYAQSLPLIKDDLVNKYMKNGYANEHFLSIGTEDKKHLKQGTWKDYEVIEDFEYAEVDGYPNQTFARFLLYGEGEFVDNKREGLWKFYAIQDQTFQKILQKEVSFVHGEKTGHYKYFYPSGNISVEGEYANNQYEGETKIYYEDGNLYGSIFFSQDLKTGHHHYYHHNGKLKMEHSFVNDVQDGFYQSFYSNGNVKESCAYSNGQQNGSYKYYYENGVLWTEKEYKDGLLMNVIGSYDNSGKERNKGSLKNGNGTVNHYTEEGKLYLVYTFKKGKMVKQENK